MLTDAQKQMRELGQSVPERNAYAGFNVMGKAFDPSRPDAYINSFAIKR